MGGKIAGDGYEDVPTLTGVAPYGELPDSRLQHLIGMEARVFAQHRTRERGDQRLRRIAKPEMPRHQPCREIDLPLAVEGVEQGGADRLRIRGQVVKLLAALPGNARRRHIEIAREVQRHGSVQYAAYGSG